MLCDQITTVPLNQPTTRRVSNLTTIAIMAYAHNGRVLLLVQL